MDILANGSHNDRKFTLMNPFSERNLELLVLLGDPCNLNDNKNDYDGKSRNASLFWGQMKMANVTLFLGRREYNAFFVLEVPFEQLPWNLTKLEAHLSTHKMHGLGSWDNISMELQMRAETRPTDFFDPQECMKTFRVLRHQFLATREASDDNGDDVKILESMRKEFTKPHVEVLRRQLETDNQNLELLKPSLKMDGGDEPFPVSEANELDPSSKMRLNRVLKRLQRNKSNGLFFHKLHSQQRRVVPPKLIKLLFGRLKKLFLEGKLEKVENHYKLKEGIPRDLLESYSRYASYAVVQAENKAVLAAEATKESERVSAMAEENEALLLLATEIYMNNVQPVMMWFP